MGRGDEQVVVDAVCAWLRADGWTVRTEVHWVDVLAERGGRTLMIEAKGSTSSPGLDIDTAFGQLLRRMQPIDDTMLRFGLAVRDEPRSVRAAQRIPARVLSLLRIDLYAVAEDGTVRELRGS